MNFNWVDITDDFSAASKELSLGELLHDEMFGLFEAMSAIEMMDPKMDAGMMCNRTTKKPLGFDEAVEAGVLKISDVTLDEKIGIIDDSLSCLVTWLEGHSLAQTVFTNVYLQNPLEITDNCLRAFSIVILKIVDLIREFVIKAGVFEEEDFQPLLYGYRLCYDISDSKASSMVREVEDELQKRVKSAQRLHTGVINAINEKSGQNNKLCEYSAENSEVNQCLALTVRLKFFRLLLSLLSGLKKEMSSKQGNRDNRRWTDSDSNKRQLDEFERQLLQSKETFQFWEESLSLGVQPRISHVITEEGLQQQQQDFTRPDYPTIMGFDPLINQRLLPPTFPRYTKMKSRREAVSYAKSLVIRIGRILQIYQFTWFHESLQFFDSFSKSNSQSSCVLSRSILQVLFLRQGNLVLGDTPMSDCLRDAVHQFIKPPSLQAKSPLLSNNPQAKDYLDMFFSNCCRPMASLLQVSGHNRARQRERLTQILEDFATLQNEAEKLDTFLNRFSQKLDVPFSHMGYFSTWIIYHILRIMVQYVLSGFELELYSTHEFPYIFWYLYEFLYGWFCSTLNRAISLQETLQESGSASSKNQKKKQKKQRPKQKAISREAQTSRALQELCGGYYRSLSAFKIEGKLKQPLSGMNSEQVRYEHRFSPFTSVVAPPVVSYSQYHEMDEQARSLHSATDLYVMACNCFNQAKVLLEEISDPDEEISTFIKVAKTNLVVVKLLLAGQTKNSSKVYPEFDFSVHKNFPVIRIW